MIDCLKSLLYSPFTKGVNTIEMIKNQISMTQMKTILHSVSAESAGAFDIFRRVFETCLNEDYHLLAQVV